MAASLLFLFLAGRGKRRLTVGLVRLRLRLGRGLLILLALLVLGGLVAHGCLDPQRGKTSPTTMPTTVSKKQGIHVSRTSSVAGMGTTFARRYSPRVFA